MIEEKEIYRIIDEIQILQKASVEHTGRIKELEKQATERSNEDSSLIDPGKFEQEVQKLISNLYKVANSKNREQIEREILAINAVLEIHRQCKKEVSA